MTAPIQDCCHVDVFVVMLMSLLCRLRCLSLQWWNRIPGRHLKGRWYSHCSAEYTRNQSSAAVIYSTLGLQAMCYATLDLYGMSPTHANLKCMFYSTFRLCSMFYSLLISMICFIPNLVPWVCLCMLVCLFNIHSMWYALFHF